MMRSMNSLPIHIRCGRQADLTALAAFTQNTFSWGDYIGREWEHWVESKNGELLVAEVNSTFAGTVHVRYLENREAWLEGVRVHPEHRRQNIATTLIETAHAHARKKRCRTMRLETGAHNPRARAMFEKIGYRLRVDYASYQAHAQSGELQNMRRARLRDVPTCLEIWNSSWMKRHSHNVVPSPLGWRWWEVTSTRLCAMARAARVWLTNDARAFMVALPRRADSFDIQMLAGEKRAAMKLLDAARIIAQQAGYKELFWMTPNIPRAQQWAKAAGYALDETGMLIYEYAL